MLWNDNYVFFHKWQHDCALHTRVQMSIGVGERHLAGQRTSSSIHHTCQAGDTTFVRIFCTILHHESCLRQIGNILLLVFRIDALLHHGLNDSFCHRELCLHRCVTTQHSQLSHRCHLIATTYRNLTDNARNRSFNGAETKIHLCAVHSGTGLSHRSLSLAVGVLRVFEHVAAYNLLFK